MAEESKPDIKSKMNALFKKKEQKEEKEYDVDSLHERLRRRRMISKEGYVILKVLDRNPKGEYMLESTLIKRNELPEDAVQVTSESNTYCIDRIKSSEWYIRTHSGLNVDPYEAQFTASDAALYMTSNKIDNALAIKWTELSHVDFKKYIWLVIAGLVVLLFVIMRMVG